MPCAEPDPCPRADRLLRASVRCFVGIVWVSALLFGLYIFAFYVNALLQGTPADWNQRLPGLFDKQTPGATIGIGIHFAAGALILLLGCIQLIESLRSRFPAVHRWLGRVYVVSALLTAAGGLWFIFAKGTIGGTWMDIGFTGYGILMGVAAVSTIHFARKGDFERHRAWAIRLFALAIGSWLYRMYYGFWFLCVGGIGHTADFTGPFDQVMTFFFYLPNLAVAEIVIGRKQRVKTPIAKAAAAVSLFLTSLFLLTGTYYFTKVMWLPAILKAF